MTPPDNWGPGLRGDGAGGEEEAPRVVVRDRRRFDPVTYEQRTPEARDAAGSDGAGSGGAGSAAEEDPAGGALPGVDAQYDAFAAELAERTADLQRLSAEYANYRRRVERDRVAVVEAAQDNVLEALLPVLDDVDRAREHGDLNGTFKAVADQIAGVLARFGVEGFGVAGDPFDPTQHEAVMHSTSPEVTGPTCVAVMRQGYRHGERVLRPAMVAVAEPAEPASAVGLDPAVGTDPTAQGDPSTQGDPTAQSN
ncbi:MAG: nucleotide exchange factor GrpE [Geodermatophilaceae bacterium]|nr:nucleotide exchange factor GrpE [Geodermatophilaceae bacterium]